MQPQGNEGKKVYIFGLGHMTKTAAMPIYGINLKTFSSLGLIDLFDCDDKLGFLMGKADKVLFLLQLMPYDIKIKSDSIPLISRV